MVEDLFIDLKTTTGTKPAKKISNSTMLILAEAENQGIVYEQIPYTGIFKLQLGDHVEYFHQQIPSKTTSSGVFCCDQKRITRHLLSQKNVAVPQGYIIQKKDTPEYWTEVFHALQKPLVVKPSNAAQGKGVVLSISDLDVYLNSVRQLIEKYGNKSHFYVLVEEMFKGQEYRILVSRKKVISIIDRIPANVTGDGTATIKDLIRKKNTHPYRNNKKIPLKKIVIDAEIIDNLHRQHLDPNSVLPQGKRIFLRQFSLLAINNGGDTVDVTNQAHPSVRQIALRAIRAIPGLALAGVDFMTTDITKAQTPATYRIIEMNASPSLDWQEFPYIGKRRRVALEFLRIMFPELSKRTDRPALRPHHALYTKSDHVMLGT